MACALDANVHLADGQHLYCMCYWVCEAYIWLLGPDVCVSPECSNGVDAHEWIQEPPGS